VEQVGVVDPIKKEKNLKADRIKYWMSVGAKPSVSVYNMLVEAKVVAGKKIPNSGKPKKKEEAKPAAAPTPAAAK